MYPSGGRGTTDMTTEELKEDSWQRTKYYTAGVGKAKLGQWQKTLVDKGNKYLRATGISREECK